MPATVVQFLGPERKVIATAKVVEEAGHFAGRIDLSTTPRTTRQLFEEFEEVVNGQVFSLLDEIEERIAAAAPVAVFDDGREAVIQDLQVYPSSGRVSFKLGKDAARPAGRA
jgi:hypothetical protein